MCYDESTEKRGGGDVDDWTSLRSSMQDAGCEESSVRRAEALYGAGARTELIRWLRSCRCRQLEELHEKQKKLDRLDLMIRRAKQG